jgi:hypothetical protein
MDTGAKRSIFLELTERLGTQGQFKSGGLFGSTCPAMLSLNNEESNILSIADLRGSNFIPRHSSKLGKQQRWGLLTHGLTPPLGHARK